MTPAESDPEIQNLRGQVLQLQQQQDARKKYWFRWAIDRNVHQRCAGTYELRWS